jgi:hypothetical protein
MNRPEIILEHPVEFDGVRYERLTVASFDAVAHYESHNLARVILSFANVYGVPRRVMRALHPSDAVRAGALVLALREELFGD